MIIIIKNPNKNKDILGDIAPQVSNPTFPRNYPTY